MLNLKESAVVVVAGEAVSTVDQLIGSYVAQLRFSAEALDGLRGSGIPIVNARSLRTTLLEGQIAGGESLTKMETAIAKLQAIQARSNQAEVANGCAAPWGREWFVSAATDNVPTAAVAPQMQNQH